VADWEIMGHQVTLPAPFDAPIPIPAGWEPIGTLARQANTAVVLCRRQAAGPAPPSDPPVISSLDPNTLASGGTPATIEVYGSNFDAQSVINVDGAPRATFYRPDLMSPGTVQVTVVGANGTSNAVTFTYT